MKVQSLILIVSLMYAQVWTRHIGRRKILKRSKTKKEVQMTNHAFDPHSKRYDVPYIQDERKGISNDIQRELLFSGHDDKDVVSSLQTSKDNLHNDESQGHSYDSIRDSKNNFLGNSQDELDSGDDVKLPTGAPPNEDLRKNPEHFSENQNEIQNDVKPRQSALDVENAFLATTDDTMQTRSIFANKEDSNEFFSLQENKLEAKSVFPQQKIQQTQTYYDNDGAENKNREYHGQVYYDRNGIDNKDNEYHAFMRAKEIDHEVDDKDERGSLSTDHYKNDDNQKHFTDSSDHEEVSKLENGDKKVFENNRLVDKQSGVIYDNDRSAFDKEYRTPSMSAPYSLKAGKFTDSTSFRDDEINYGTKTEKTGNEVKDYHHRHRKPLTEFIRRKDRDIYKSLFHDKDPVFSLYGKNDATTVSSNKNFPTAHLSFYSEHTETGGDTTEPFINPTRVKAMNLENIQISDKVVPLMISENHQYNGMSTKFQTPHANVAPSEIDDLDIPQQSRIGLPDRNVLSSEVNRQRFPTSQYSRSHLDSRRHAQISSQPLINIGLINPVTTTKGAMLLPAISNIFPTLKRHLLKQNTYERNSFYEKTPTTKHLDYENDLHSNLPENEKKNTYSKESSVDTNVDENTKYIMAQVSEHRAEQKRKDTDLRQAIHALNEKEQNVAATEALKDDRNDLAAAQQIADDNPVSNAAPKGFIPVLENLHYKRHMIGSRMRGNEHHYLVDQEPVHYRHNKFVHIYPSSKFRHQFTPYSNNGKTTDINSEQLPDAFPMYVPHRPSYQTLMRNREKHVFDEIFPNSQDETEVVTEPTDGYRAMDDSTSTPQYIPSMKKRVGSMQNNYAFVPNGKGIQFVHLNKGNMENTNYVEANREDTLSTLPSPHDGITDNIVSDLTKGNELTHVKGEDHVHIKGSEGGHSYDGWISHPYTYGGRIGNGAVWGDHSPSRTNDEPAGQAGQAMSVSTSQQNQLRSTKRFPIEMDSDDEEVDDYGALQYNSFNMPVHGAVVSEKDAKKIGLYDDSYLKKLGIWEDASDSGLWGGGTVPWGMVGIPWGNGGLNEAWKQGRIEKNAELRGMNKSIKNGNKSNGNSCMIPADVAFLFDATKAGAKKKEYFDTFVEFAKQIIGYHQPSLEGYHYGAVVYSENAQLKFDFEKSYDANGVLTELDLLKNISFDNKGSNLEEGLRVAKEELFDKTAREWVYQVLVILTDTKGKGDVEKWSKALRDSTVNIYLIGLANSDSTADIGQMEKIATKPYKNHVFQVNADHLLGTNEPVSHPQHLARIIPNQICRLNMVFVVDLNISNTTTVEHVKTFIKETAANLGFSQWGSHVALIAYGVQNKFETMENETRANEGWDLMSKLDHESFNDAVNKLEQDDGQLKDLGHALEVAYKYYVEEPSEFVIGAFWRYINVTIVLNSQHLDGEYEEQARNLRDHGIIVHAVGLNMMKNSTDNGALTQLASSSEEFHVHHLDNASKLKLVAKSMRQYLSQLLYSQEDDVSNVEGGWEASYGNIMLGSYKDDQLRIQMNSNNNSKSNTVLVQPTLKNSNSSFQAASVPLADTLSQEPDWTKFIKSPLFQPTSASVNKDDVELQEKIYDAQTTTTNKETAVRYKIDKSKNTTTKL